MIGEVIGLGTELEPILPEDWEGFDQREIPVHQAGCVNIVADAFLKIKCPGRGRSPQRSSGASGRGEPLRAAGSTCGTSKFAQCPYPSMLHPELPHGSGWNIGRFAVEAAELSHSGVVVGDPDRAGKAGLHLSVAADLPTTCHFAQKILLSPKEGQHIQVVDYENLADIELRRPPKIRSVVGVGNDRVVIGTVVHVLDQV